MSQRRAAPWPAGRLVATAVAVIVLAACGDASSGTFELPADQAAQYETAYLATVVAEPGHAGENGEHVVVRNNWDHRTDMGGWFIETDDGARLPLGIGRQIEPDAELRVYAGCGEDTDDAVYACLEGDVLDADGGVVTLRDSAGGEVARFAFGAAAG